MIFNKNKAKTSIDYNDFNDYYSRVSHEYKILLNSFNPLSSVSLMDVMSTLNKFNPGVYSKLPFEEDELIFSLIKKGLTDHFKDKVSIIFNNTCLNDELIKSATLDFGFIYLFNEEESIKLKPDNYGEVTIKHDFNLKKDSLLSTLIVRVI